MAIVHYSQECGRIVRYEKNLPENAKMNQCHYFIPDTSDLKTEESLERKFPRYQVPNIILYIKGAEY